MIYSMMTLMMIGVLFAKSEILLTYVAVWALNFRAALPIRHQPNLSSAAALESGTINALESEKTHLITLTAVCSKLLGLIGRTPL